ncbi:MAG: UDP-N-acetylmuramoyl-L-alanyl-D-glutamate--2,6-diaminopimelate ligase [Lachnospiraceae bacterium]|nr:UDP-N-acetylmuramoyl-L-alanyl-D-glutamate--2,6-diaminopimelate ligase [Lachnospiraceae bacterium]
MVISMKKLSELIKAVEQLIDGGIAKYENIGDTEVSSIIYDTRSEIAEGAAFVAMAGATFDGHSFAAEAEKKGASVIFAEHEVELEGSAKLVVVSDTRKALSLLSQAWFDYPAAKLVTIGLTGTKGKSTTCYMIHNILEKAGRRCGIIGTIGILINGTSYPTHNTTPESYLVQQYLRQMVDEGCDTLLMEVSSQGLKQHRVFGMTFDYGVFTNLGKDHIGGAEHADFEEYLDCKAILFGQSRTAIVNANDSHVAEVLKYCKTAVEGFGLAQNTNILENSGIKPSGMLMGDEIRLFVENGTMGISFDYSGSLTGTARLSIPGKFNVMNALCATAVAAHFTDDVSKIADALFNTHVRGRLEPVKISDKYTLLIDYAHNAVALESVLETLRAYEPKRLVNLFGCGGNRSKDRRFEMGEVSSRMADLTVVTSDNPRFEKPEDIIADILVGVSKADGKYITIPDRREAIKYCIENAQPGDCILLAGKGNEDYQEIEGVRYPMDERDIISDIIAELR